MASRTLVSADLSSRAQGIVLVGFLLGAVASFGVMFFVAAEILSDPGGWLGVGYVAAWLIPSLAMTVVAVLWPRTAFWILCVLVAALVGASFATWAAPRQVYDFENTHGPVFLLAALAIYLPIVVLGRSLPSRAGWLLVAAIALPIVVQGVSLFLAREPTVIMAQTVVSMPFAIAAAFYILGGMLDYRDRRAVTPAPQRSPQESPLR